MARPIKPINATTKHYSKQERKEREEAEKKINGNVSNDKIKKAPASLSKEGKKIYKEIVSELEKTGIDITNLDLHLLEATANAIDTMRKTQVILHEDILNKTANNLYFKAFGVFKQCISELGLSPSSRAKLSMIQAQNKAEEDDILLKILRGEDVDIDDIG